MLLGMYFNGYVLFAIFLGQTMGYIVFGRDTINLEGGDTVASGGCC
jgi:copper transporter 1